MTRDQLVRLIHIAKTQLKLDDDTYRAALVAATGKESCSRMTHAELTRVYDAFVERGFKRRFKPDNKRVKGKVKAAEISKITAIWITMHRQKFVADGTESALNKFVQRQTAKENGGAGVAELGWLNSTLAYQVLESLKQWHSRLMLDAIKKRGQRLPDFRGYDAVCQAYNQENAL